MLFSLQGKDIYMKKYDEAILLKSPCRNFCILGNIVITDPYDNREKLAMSTFVADGTGEFLLLDPVNDTLESFVLPYDKGSWALCMVDEERIAIGTCSGFAAIHIFNLKKREFETSVNVEGNTYVFDLIKASDGNLYGGTYPRCEIFRYDTKNKETKILCRASDNKENMYARLGLADVERSGNIFYKFGQKEDGIVAYNIYDEKIVKTIAGRVCMKSDSVFHVAKNFFAVNDGERITCYDRKDASVIKTYGLDEKIDIPEIEEKSCNEMKNGDVVFPQGQSYVIIKKETGERIKRRIPGTAPITGMLDIACDERGNVWGSSGFGQTVCSLDPDTLESFSTDVVTTAGGGEVYTIHALSGKMYFLAYSRSMHVVYDPEKEWNVDENVNPRTVRCLSDVGYIRPLKSVVAPDGNIYTTHLAAYGRYGGAVSKFDIKNNVVTHWENTVNGLGLSVIVADNEYLYVCTYNGGNGLAFLDVPSTVIKLDYDFNVIKSRSLDLPMLRWGAEVNGRLMFSYVKDGRGRVISLDKELLDEKDHECPVNLINRVIKFNKRPGYAVAMNGCVGIMDELGNIEITCRIKEGVNTIALSRDDRLFALSGKDIYEIK